jgi:hypothetical protein
MAWESSKPSLHDIALLRGQDRLGFFQIKIGEFTQNLADASTMFNSCVDLKTS